METGFARAVRANLIVAVQTQIGHGGFIESRMALIAIRFKFRVPFDQVTRHQHTLLDGLSPSRSAEQ